MADKGPTVVVGSKQIALSRALGAAFLSHQVEQLERTAGAQNGWRGENRRQPQQQQQRGSPPRTRKDGPKPAPDARTRQRRSNEGARKEKDADVIVVDASVLVHCLNQFKAWCKDGREETVIVPLEALNTLDLLKKGTSSIAQRARAASRILESQVGTNPRIQVQSDDAYVLWDSLPFSETGPDDRATSPEWVRRTVCCAQYEMTEGAKASQPRTVALAIADPAGLARLAAGQQPDAAPSPVPLPAPHPLANKHEARVGGALPRLWGNRAGLRILDVRPNPLTHGSEEGGNEVERPNNARRGPPNAHRGGRRGDAGFGGGQQRRGSTGNGPGQAMVERPPAVQAMMAAVSQPSKVVRVLARGEKLEP